MEVRYFKMLEEQDRLPDWAYTEDELDRMAKELIENDDLQMKGHLVLYKLYKDSVDTGIVMLLAVESISDGLHAINRYWSQYGMYADIEAYNEEIEYSVMYRLKALEIALNKFKYIGKINCPGSTKLYRHNKWFNELL